MSWTRVRKHLFEESPHMTLCVLDLVWLTSVVVTLTRGWRPLLYSRPEKNMSLDASEKCSRTNVLLFTTASADTLICSRKGSCGFLPSRRRQRRRNATVHRVFRDDHVKSNKLASHACVRTCVGASVCVKTKACQRKG